MAGNKSGFLDCLGPGKKTPRSSQIKKNLISIPENLCVCDLCDHSLLFGFEAGGILISGRPEGREGWGFRGWGFRAGAVLPHLTPPPPPSPLPYPAGGGGG